MAHQWVLNRAPKGGRESCLRLLVRRQELLARDTGLVADGPQCLTFDVRMVGHGERRPAPIWILAHEGNILSFSKHAKAKKPRCLQ